MAGDEGKGERGFTVVDKREAGDDAAAQEPGSEETYPKVDFATFCLSLGTSALYHLGVVGDPETGQTSGEPNLPLARQTIDTLEMLERKTQGNLDGEEAQLLEALLYELRMRFVEAKGGGGSAAGDPPGE
jgi:hypothetical protein